jgi:threonine/homoserine/homoserine lactone efflux protein
MGILLFILLSFLLGFLAAIPVGASQIEIAKRALNKQRGSAYMVALGTVTSDIIYGSIALFSASQFLRGKNAIAIFELAATLILWFLAYLTFHNIEGKKLINFNNNAGSSKNWSFVTGFSLSITNPMMIFWWLMGFRVIKSFDLINDFNFIILLLFLLSGGLGLITYLFIFVHIIGWLKKYLNQNWTKKFYYAMGIFLVLISFYFLYHALKLLLS